MRRPFVKIIATAFDLDLVECILFEWMCGDRLGCVVETAVATLGQ